MPTYRIAAVAALALALAAPALAQKMDNMKMPADKMNSAMSADAPMLKYTAMPSMNMMMSGGAVEFGKMPGETLLSRSAAGHNATLIYQSQNAKGLFDFYNKAIMGEGWKEDMNMKMGMMGKGEYAEAYVMKNWKLDLKAVNRGGRTTVTLRTH